MRFLSGWYFELPYPNSQVEARSTVLISYDIKSLTWYATISQSLWSKVVLLYDGLKRGFTKRPEPRNLNLEVITGRKKRNTFPQKLNLIALANCAMFADEYWDIQTEKIKTEFLKFSLFTNLENETLNKRVQKNSEEELGKSVEDQVNTICSTYLAANMASTER